MSGPYNTLFATLSANGQSASLAIGRGVHELDVYVGDSTTWGSGTLIVQASPDDGTTWHSVPSASWTSGTARLTTVPLKVYGASHIRFSLSGATSPSITPQVFVKRVEGRTPNVQSLTANGTLTIPMDRVPEEFGVFMSGTWGSGTAKLQVSVDNGTTWYTVQSKTANSYAYVSGNRQARYQIVLTGATTPSLTFVCL